MPITLILRNPLDRDAREYISRAGVTDATGRIQLNAFVRGVKNLGVWANLVCWPLRSTQNSGGADPTNTTVYSLGGLGTYNGTRINGPTWGPDGINFVAASNTHVTTGFNMSFNQDKTWIAAAQSTGPGNGIVPRIIGREGAAESELTINISNSTTGSGLNTWSGSISSTRNVSFALTSWHEYGVSFDYNNTTARYLLDGTTEDISRLSDSSVSVAANIGNGQNNTNNWDGKMAYVIRVSSAVTANVMISLGQLAKQTLGTGLAIP
jgi:hypothetical protein